MTQSKETMMDTIKPWYLSKTVWGGLIAGAASLSGLLGVPIAPDDEARLTELVLEAIALGGALTAILGRIAATTRIV